MVQLCNAAMQLLAKVCGKPAPWQGAANLTHHHAAAAAAVAECMEFFAFGLGAQAPKHLANDPAFAPWPQPGELKPEGVPRYFGREYNI
jgi:hypothetical protein